MRSDFYKKTKHAIVSILCDNGVTYFPLNIKKLYVFDQFLFIIKENKLY